MIQSFHIKNFRSCPEWKFSFGKKTFIMGENGSGKTHILDALHFLGWSPFVYTDSHIESGCLFEIHFEENTLSKNYSYSQEENRAQFWSHWQKVSKPKYLEFLPFRTVFVSPFDMNLFYFAPSMRREYIDNILSRSFGQFRKIQKDYELTMRQRNTLLKRIKDGESKKDDLHFWNTKFAELAETYLLYRKIYFDFVEEHIPQIHEKLPKYQIALSYHSTVEEKRHPGEDIQSCIIRYLRENQERDILTGHTPIGPHRDDFDFVIETKHWIVSWSQFLSRWEMKMLLLELKKIEVLFLEKYVHIPIILLIDDIFAELDEINIIRFLNSLTTYQTILTSQKALPEGENWSDFICINLKDT